MFNHFTDLHFIYFLTISPFQMAVYEFKKLNNTGRKFCEKKRENLWFYLAN